MQFQAIPDIFGCKRLLINKEYHAPREGKELYISFVNQLEELLNQPASNTRFDLRLLETILAQCNKITTSKVISKNDLDAWEILVQYIHACIKHKDIIG